MMKNKFCKAVLMTILCSILMFGSTLTVFASGGEEVEEPITDSIFTEPVENTEESEEKSTEDLTEELTEEDFTAFTPDGNAQLVDEADETDEKLFYTITTINGNYFYLIIDKARDENNVYMLDMIDEEDLMTLIEAQQEDGATTGNATSQESEDATIGLKIDTAKNEESMEEEEVTTEPESIPEESKEQTSSSGNSTLIILLVVIGAGAAGVYYYLKFVKGKKENFKMEDDLDFYDDEEYENEDNEKEADEEQIADTETEEDSEEEV